jgi:hypothetical protein
MKKMILSSYLTCKTGLPLLAFATGLPVYDVTSFLEIAVGKSDKKHSPHVFPAEEKRKKTEAAKSIRLRLAQLRYAFLVLSFSGVVWFLTFLLLHIIGNAFATN